MAAIVANTSNNMDSLVSNAFTAVISSSRSRTVSIDGITWTVTATILTAANSWTAVKSGDTAGNGNVITVAVASGTRDINYTYDSATWTAGTNALPSTAAWSALAFGEGKFVVVSTTSSTAAASSTDGLSWTSRTLPSSANWLGVA